MALPALLKFGPATNAEFYRTWLTTDTIIDVPFLSNINLDPFNAQYTDTMVPTMAYLAWYGRHLVINPRKPVNRSNVLAAMWADLMGPYINQDKIPGQEVCRTAFVNTVTALLNDAVLPTIGDASETNYIAAHNDNTEGQWRGVKNEVEDQATPENAMRILRHLAERAGQAFSIGGVSMIVHVYLSILKRGIMSEAVTDKITNRLAADLKITNLRIDTAACRRFFTVFGNLINDVTIQQVNTHWTGLLPIPALRLKSIVTQAAGSGLTALSVTGRAIRIYHDFNWARILEMYTDEWDNFEAAVEAVGNNVWYEFRRDRGPVISTKYKNLSYVAKELLIKVNGESSLRNYAGWTRRAKYQAIVDQLIADYKAAKTANTIYAVAMPVVALPNRVRDLRALIQGGRNLYD